MPVLTADELNTIAENLLSIAEAIDHYIDAPPIPLTPEQVSAFEAQRDKIEDDVDTIADMALTINLDNAARRFRSQTMPPLISITISSIWRIYRK